MRQEKYCIEGRLALNPGRVRGNSPKRKTGKIPMDSGCRQEAARARERLSFRF